MKDSRTGVTLVRSSNRASKPGWGILSRWEVVGDRERLSGEGISMRRESEG